MRRSKVKLRHDLVRGSVFALFIGACCLPLQGCYQRVTRATGFGADQYTVSEPYQRNSKIDDWVFGREENRSSSGSRIPPTPRRD